MRPWTFLLASLTFCIGCTHITLERRTINQASTLADLQYRQVLDNLAMFLCNKDSLAWHLRLAGGTVQVADQGFVSVLADTIHKANVSPTVSAQRTGVGQWDVNPAVDADDLELLQLAYQKVVDPADFMIDKRIDEAICELCIRFDLLPNENALKRMFATNDAVTKIQEALVSVCNELDELDKLNKHEPPTVIEERINEVGIILCHPEKIPDCEKSRLNDEMNRLFKIRCCIIVREKDGEDNKAAKAYYTAWRTALVSRKLDLIRALQLVANILRPGVVGGARSAMTGDSRMGVGVLNVRSIGRYDSGQLQPLVQPVAPKYLLLMVMNLICDPGYMPPAATPEATRRNVGLIAQAEDKIQKMKQLIEDPKFKTPWFHCGGAKDVPKCACYVGHYCNCGCDMYVWVMPEQLEVLRDFVLVVLGLAPIEKQDILSGNPSGRGTAFSPAFAGAH